MATLFIILIIVLAAMALIAELRDDNSGAITAYILCALCVTALIAELKL